MRSITAPLSPPAARRFMERFGTVVLNSYGQAEVGEVVGWTAADAREHPEKLGAAGRPHAGVDIRVVDDDGREVEPGAVGELLVRPPRMAAGYAGGASLDDRVDADGFVRTGDHARVDAEGFVWIEGRTSDLINRGGNKVFPEQVEEVLRLVPGVDDVAVVGRPDERLGEVPVAVVVGSRQRRGPRGGVPGRAARPTRCRSPSRRAESLPRNEIGKLLRRQLADDVAAPGRLSPVATPPTSCRRGRGAPAGARSARG